LVDSLKVLNEQVKHYKFQFETTKSDKVCAINTFLSYSNEASICK